MNNHPHHTRYATDTEEARFAQHLGMTPDECEAYMRSHEPTPERLEVLRNFYAGLELRSEGTMRDIALMVWAMSPTDTRPLAQVVLELSAAIRPDESK